MYRNLLFLIEQHVRLNVFNRDARYDVDLENLVEKGGPGLDREVVKQARVYF